MSHLDLEASSPEKLGQKLHEQIPANIASLNVLCLPVHLDRFDPAGGDQNFFFTNFFYNETRIFKPPFGS